MSDIKDLWQRQSIQEYVFMSSSELEASASGMYDRLSRRNLYLYLYSGGNLLIYLWAFATGRLTNFFFASLLMVAAHIFVAYQVWKRFTPRRAPLQNSGQAVLQFQRQELERQHGAISKAWLWYIAPFWPPFLWQLFNWYQRIDFSRQGSMSMFFSLQMTLLAGAMFWAFVWMMFSRHATRLELELERLRLVRAE
jgi:hypothetical protein